MSAPDLHHQLTALTAERAAAVLAGLSGDATYGRDLEDELEATRHAFIGAAVTEIATLRAKLAGPQIG